MKCFHPWRGAGFSVLLLILLAGGCGRGPEPLAGGTSAVPGTVVGRVAIDDGVDADSTAAAARGGPRDWSEAVFVRSPYAYVSANEFGLGIVDVSEPSAPWLVGQYDGFTVYGAWVTPDHRFAYLADDNVGLRVLDLADPANPILVRTVASAGPSGGEFSLFTAGAVTGFTTTAGTFLAVGTNEGLVLFDLADPADPGFVFGSPEWIGRGSLKVRDHYLVIGGGDAWVLDVSDPSAPRLVARVTSTPGHPFSATGADLWTDTWTLAASGGGRISFHDVSDPEAVKLLSELGPSAFAPFGVDVIQSQGLMISGEYVHAALGAFGMATIERMPGEPPTFRLVRVTAMPDLDPADSVTPYAMNVWAGDGYAYVACKEDGLRIVKVEE